VSFVRFFDYPSDDTTDRGDRDDLLFLGSCSEEDWAVIQAHTGTSHFFPGDVVIAPGEADRSLYLVVDGVLEVHIPGGRFGRGRRLSTVGPGSVLGEVAFLDGEPRSALVRALTDVHLLCLTYEAFERLGAAQPALALLILSELGRILAQRLRAMQALVRGGFV
jgi:CRP-like cAMP-binding protein